MSGINPDRLLGTFLDLVRLDSESGNERAVADYLRPRLEALGGEVHEDQAGLETGGNCGNLIARFGGDGMRQPLMLCAHMDVMVPGKGVSPEVRDGYVYSNGETVLGADDKAGVAMVLESLMAVPQAECPPLDIVFTVGEECGLNGSKKLAVEQLRARFGYILDADGALGRVIVAAPIHDHYRIEVKGQAAHAGMAPETGKNAIQALSRAVSDFPQGRLAEDTTANIGKISGGTALNVVADRAWVEGEIRSHRETELQAQLTIIRGIMKKVAAATGTSYNMEVERQYENFRVAESSQLLSVLSQALPDGVKPEVDITNGGSDANILSAKGIETVVLGIGYEKIHTVEERMPVAALSDMACLVSSLLRNWK